MIGNTVGVVHLVEVLNDEAADLVSDDHRHFLVLVMVSLYGVAVVALVLDRLSNELDEHFDDLHVELAPELLHQEEEEAVEVGVVHLLIDALVVPKEGGQEVLLADAVAQAVNALQCSNLERKTRASVLAAASLGVFLDVAAAILQDLEMEFSVIRVLLLQVCVKIINVVGVCQEDGSLEHAVIVWAEEEGFARNEQFLHHHYELLPSNAHIAEDRQARQAGLNLNQVVGFFEEAAFSELRWQFAEAVGVGGEVKLDGLTECVAEDHDAAVDAVDVGLDELAGCIFGDVAAVGIQDVLSLALEVLRIVVVLVGVPLHERQADLEEEPVPDLEGLVEELVQSDDVGERNQRNLEEPRMRQRLRRVVERSELLDDELWSIVEEVLADLKWHFVLFLFQLSVGRLHSDTYFGVVVDDSHAVLLDLVDPLDVFVAVRLNHQLDYLFCWRERAIVDVQGKSCLDDFLHLRVLHYACLQQTKVLL